MAGALSRGELSYAKVRALTRVATSETEVRLLNVGRAGTASHVERIVRGWRRVDRHAEARESARQHARRGLHIYHDEDGTVVIRGRLTPEVGALLMKALEAAGETLYQRRRKEEVVPRLADQATDPPALAQQRADALVLIAEAALHQGLDPGHPAEHYQVVVHVDAPVLSDPDQPGQSVLETGTHVSAETSQRLACDATRVVMKHDADGRITEGRGADTNDTTCLTPGFAASGPWLPLPGLWHGVRSGASSSALGSRWAHYALESRASVSAAPSSRARGGL